MIRSDPHPRNLAVESDTQNVDLTEEQRGQVDTAIHRIDRATRDLTEPHLFIRIERYPSTRDYEVSMRLEAAGRSLHGYGKARRLADAVRTARERIIGRVMPFKASLRRGYHYGQKPVDVYGVSAEPAGDPREAKPTFEEFQKNLDTYWQPLVRQISREIAVLEINQQLPHGEVAPQEVVDEVVVRAYENFRNRPNQTPLERWLYELARRILNELRRQHARERPLSEMAPASPSASEPEPVPPNPLADDAMVLMNLLEPEPEPFPGEEMAGEPEMDTAALAAQRDEMQRLLYQALAGMPATWREAIWFHYLEGYELDEIAHMQRLNEEQVRENLLHGVSLLRDRMEEWRDWLTDLQNVEQGRHKGVQLPPRQK